ncbi:MAG: helix-turn-helix transcriptional regulator [Planctomycetales bacterium]|nr:helix-turn-helix transcriptional regulator [Planctomycetales bacterium]
MAININIDVMLAKRKMSVTELAEQVGITMANISILKNGKAKAIRFSTLEAICKALECQPGDILEIKMEPDGDDAPESAPCKGSADPGHREA